MVSSSYLSFSSHCSAIHAIRVFSAPSLSKLSILIPRFFCFPYRNRISLASQSPSIPISSSSSSSSLLSFSFRFRPIHAISFIPTFSYPYSSVPVNRVNGVFRISPSLNPPQSTQCDFCGNSPFPPISLPPNWVTSRSSSSGTETEILSSDQCNSCSLSNGGDECMNVDSEKVYRAIVENLGSDKSMEAALDSAGVELKTELVNEILQRLRFEEKTAFRFFTWAGHQEGYTHEPQTYNEMIDILSSTKYKAKQFAIVCDILDYMKRKGKNSVPVDVLLIILRKYAEKHLTHLQKFTKKKKIRVKTQPEINAFNLMLDSLCKCSLVEEADLMVKKVKNKITPDANTYNILFFGWCRVKNPTRGMKVLEEMIEMGHKPENFTYNTAIDTYCRAGMVSEATELFEFMRTKGSTLSSPTAKTYCIMIVALAKSNRMDECFQLMADMRSSGCLPDVSTYKELIEGMCMAGKVEEAYKFLEEMGSKGFPPDIVTYNCFLKVLCNLKKADEALRLFGRMVEVGCLPSVHTFNMLITMFFEIGDVDGVFETWNEMDKRGCARDVDTYCVMIEGLFGCGRSEDACLLLDDVVNKGLKLPYQMFDTFLMQLSKIGDLHSIHQLSEHMRKFYNPAMARRFSVSQKRQSMSLRRK
eukprot:TRINITY_DN13950_c1_g1_i2.p1 TRINITY_DN13950_c1_g1~~TRINITY_DN13950_c1_g1_i2.p1  ORF type:complete len:679 (-),score=116.38 TRINITY_DN13950_c1_g1_i2:784-2712(-)